jgi:hypothetical protein
MKTGAVKWATMFAVACVTTSSALAEDKFVSRYTKAGLSSPDCKQAKGGAEGMSCKGLAGWILNVGYPAFGVTINFANEKGQRASTTATQGRQVSVNDLASKSSTIEWRGAMRNGVFEPHAAIVRVLVFDAAQTQSMIEDGSQPASARPTQVLTVTRLGREGSCLIAYVDTQANPKRNDLARSAADSLGPSAKCPVAKVAIWGTKTPVLASYID